MAKIISIRIDQNTEKQIEELKKYISDDITFVKKVTTTDIVLIAIDTMWNDLLNPRLQNLKSNKSDTS